MYNKGLFYTILFSEVIPMPFVPKKTKEKVEAGYKTIYLRKTVIDAVEKIAQENNSRFNNVVVSMIERCLEENAE